MQASSCNPDPIEPDLIGYTSISAVDYHSLALKTDGSLWSWGDNLNGQLGDGTTILHDTHILVGRIVVIPANGCLGWLWIV